MHSMFIFDISLNLLNHYLQLCGNGKFICPSENHFRQYVIYKNHNH
jgi:hypothetical protein